MNKNLETLKELKDFLKKPAKFEKLRKKLWENMKAIQNIEISKETILQHLRLEISNTNKIPENPLLTPLEIMNKLERILSNFRGEVKAINDEEVKELALILIGLLNLLNDPSYSFVARTIVSNIDDLINIYTNVPEDILLARDEVYRRIISQEMQGMKHDITKIEILNDLGKNINYDAGITTTSKLEDPYISEKKAMIREWLYDLLLLSKNFDNFTYIDCSLAFIRNLMLRFDWNDADMVSQVEELEQITAITAISRAISLHGLSFEYLDTTGVDNGYKKR